MYKLLEDHSMYNRFIVGKGLRRSVYVDQAKQYKDQQELSRKVKALLTSDVRSEIINNSIDAIYHPDTKFTDRKALVRQSDFPVLVDKLDHAKDFERNGFMVLLDVNITWAFLFLKYPRKFGYLLKHIEF